MSFSVMLGLLKDYRSFFEGHLQDYTGYDKLSLAIIWETGLAKPILATFLAVQL